MKAAVLFSLDVFNFTGIVLKATPEKYLEVGSFQTPRGKCWTAPAIARGKLLLRNHEKIVCYDLSFR